VQILIGNGSNGVGNATFASGQRLPTSDIPERLAVADVNADGVKDLLITCRSGFVSRYLGLSTVLPFGTGTFGGLSNIAAGDSAARIAVGDFNEDGALDFAVGNAHSTSAADDGTTVFRGLFGGGGLPNGAFAEDAFYTDAPGYAVTAADLNGDGRTDLVTASAVLLRALYGSGTGPVGDADFNATGSIGGVSTPVAMTVADFNADGMADVFLVSGSSSSNASRVYLGGCASQVSTTIAATAPAAGAAVFIDGEFKPLWTEQDGNGTTTLELSRDGGVTWEPLDAHRTNLVPTLPVTGPASSQARVRVRDDLNPQRSDATDGDFSICRAFAGGTTVPLQDDGAAVRLADLDRDGDLDVLMATSQLEWRVSNGDGTFGADQNLHTAFSTGFAVADLDDDGVLDVAGGQQGRLRILLGGRNGAGQWDGTFASGHSQNHATFEVEAGDFNEDGIEDLATRTVNAAAVDSVHVYLGNGANGLGDGTFTLTSVFAGSVNSGDLEVADINRDGILDLVEGSRGVAGAPPFGLTVIRGLGAGGVGNGTFAAPLRLLPGFGISALAIGDLTGDGNPDIAAAGAAGVPRDSIVVLLGNGAGSFTYSTTRRYPGTAEPTDIELVDVDGNGQLDIVTNGFDDDNLVVLLRRSKGALTSGSFAAHQKFPADQPVDAAVADLNGDGWRDIASVDQAGRVLRVNLGACGPLPPRTIVVELPAGGESWDVGTTETLRWSAPGVAHVDVELSRDGGTTWQVLASAIQDTTMEWYVTAPAGAGALLRVRDHDAVSLADVSGAFTITGTTLDAPIARIEAPSFAPPRPNPSRGNVGFVFALPGAARMTIEVFDIAGRRVRQLADRTFAPGEHHLSWDGRDEEGSPIGAGVFFVRARGAGLEVERKFVRLR
jgi:FG-GAP-like repeat/FlgD Ig-like domain